MSVINQQALYSSPVIDGIYEPGSLHWDYANYLYDTVRRRGHHYEDCELEWDNGWLVPLKYDYTRKVVPEKHLRVVRRRLHNRNIIQWYMTHSRRDNVSDCYAINPDYYKTRRVLCVDPATNRKIYHVRQRYQTRTPVHSWQAEWLYDLDIDLDRARSIIRTMFPKSDCMPLKSYRDYLWELVRRIRNKDHFASHDFVGRFHTTVTCFPKALRPCLLHKGKPLIGFDIANAQLLLLCLLVRDFYGRSRTRKRLLSRSFTDELPADPYPYRDATYSLHGNVPDGLIRSTKLCESGLFYESMMEPGEDRSAFKTHFIKMGLSGPSKRNPTLTRFKRKHPELAATVAALKSNDYRHVSRVLQNIEATIMHDKFAGWIMRERPDIPLYLIHDGFLCPPKHSEYVVATLEDVFAKYQLEPKIRLE